MQEVIAGKIYTAKEIKEMKCTPCTHCTNTLLCNSQCDWAYWNLGERESTKYYWNGKMENGKPIYSAWTWNRVDNKSDVEQANEILEVEQVQNKNCAEANLQYPGMKADIDLCYRQLFEICSGERKEAVMRIPHTPQDFDMQFSAAFDELKAYRECGLTPEEIEVINNET